MKSHPPVVGAVIAAFRPGDELVHGVAAARQQVDVLVVVLDDRASEDDDAVLRRCEELGAIVLRHDDNRGIGAALNTGIGAASRMRPDLTHVLTLDQDSAVPEGYLRDLLGSERAARESGVTVGMIAPGEVGSMVRLKKGRHDGVVVDGGEPIQSGLLVPVEVWERLSGFDESLFIDGVDTDFYLRARDLGLACVRTPGVRLEHRLGQAITGPGDRELPLLVAATFRYHYQWRNLVLLLRRHARRHPAWAIAALGRAVRHLLIVTALSDGRRRRLEEAASGLRAGLRGESGRRPDQS